MFEINISNFLSVFEFNNIFNMSHLIAYMSLYSEYFDVVEINNQNVTFCCKLCKPVQTQILKRLYY